MIKRLIAWLYARYVLIPQLRKWDEEAKATETMVNELLNVEFTPSEVEFVIDNRNIH